MCGLFGFCGDPKIIDKNIAKAVQAKIKILGLYNIERGKHSCGVYMDNQITKGIGDDKLFNDFIQNNDLPNAFERSKNYTVIGHTRMATHGSHTYENAHPFVVDKRFILAHNGVIRNIWTLMTKYKLSHTNIHVDSLGLANLIYKEGFKVLNEYEGFAALLMAKAEEPNSLYIYRGVSKRTANGNEEEERPLYYMQTEEGIYVSSLEKSLLAISDSETDRIKQLEGNIVHKITNGKMTKSKFPVNRDTINIGVSTTTHGGSPAQNYPKPTTGTTETKPTGTGTSHASASTQTGATNSRVASSYPNFDKAVVPMIWHETLPSRVDRYAKSSGVFYQYGRFWIVESEEIRLAHGSYYINKKGKVFPNKGKDCHNYFFYEGVMMRNEKCWNTAKDDADLRNGFYNFAMMISKYSEYPVCNTRSDATNRNKNVSNYCKYRWYHNNNMLTNTGFTPKFSERNYTIRDGLTQTIGMQPVGHNRFAKKEECVDTVSLKAERSRIEGDAPIVTPPHDGYKAPVVQMPLFHQTPIFPIANAEKEKTFHEETKPVEKPEEWDVTNFYRIWDSLDQAKINLSTLELNAIRYYVCDIMMYEMEVTPVNIMDDLVETQLNMFLSMCVDSNICINDMWDEVNYEDILHYLQIAKDNPNGEYGGDSEAPADCEACEYIPKPQEITPDNVNDVFPDNLDKEPEMIDVAVEAEQAQVPQVDAQTELFEHEEEEPVVDEEKEYAFKDVVDYLGTVRDGAVDLTARDEDDFCQEVANAVFRTVDPLLYRLKELCDNHNEEALGEYVSENIKKKVQL